MSTPVLEIAPTAATGDNRTPYTYGAESGDVGVFERVLEELLDPDIEGDNLGVLISPHPLPPSSTAWERGNQAPLCRAAGEGLGVRAIITEPAPPDKGLTPAFENLVTFADFSNLTPLSPLSVNGEGGSAALRTPASPSPFTERGLGGEVRREDETPVPSSAGFPSPMPLERGSGGEGIFLNEPSASAGQGQTADTPAAKAEGDALPVPSARQGETPPLSQTPSAEPLEIRPLGDTAPEHSPKNRSELAHAESSSVPAPHALPPVQHARPAAQVDALPPNAAEPLAEPNWRIAEQITQHIERMVYDREREAITVRLDPPELGMIELRVQTTGNEVQAWVNAERDLTRQMLQQAQQQLREQLESRGLQLTHFDVGGQSNSHFAQARPFRTPAAQSVSHTHPSTATDSLNHDGRWSVWV